MENQSGKWRVVARCSSTTRDSVAEEARRAAVETSSRVRKRRTPTAPVVVANHLQAERSVNDIPLISKDCEAGNCVLKEIQTFNF